MNNSKNNYLPFLLLFIQPIFMASNLIVARGGVEYVPPISLAFWRWTAVFLILLPFTYGSLKKTLNLSESVYNSNSVAAAGIAAHETGHAIQHNVGYFPLVLRNSIYPIASLGSNLAFPLFFFGLILGYNKLLMDIGIWLFLGFVAFTIVTLPVEFNASKRAITILETSGYFTSMEMKGVKEVLTDAALTYVAAALSALVNLSRLLILRGDRD